MKTGIPGVHSVLLGPRVELRSTSCVMRYESALFLIVAFGVLSQGVSTVRADQQTTVIVQGNTAFALDLYARLAHGDGNLFFSPVSISTALAMTYAGARGETAEQIARVLHFTLPPDQLHPAFRHLIAEIQGRNVAPAAPGQPADIQITTANALWCQSGQPILPDFQQRIQVDYGGGLRPLDFRSQTEAARRTINAWVEEQTQRKIQDLLKPTELSPSSLLVLTNAIYFKALWASPFPGERTAPDDFQVSSRERVRVQMMDQTGRFRYGDHPSFQMVELPYKGDTLSMVIFLPKAVDGLAQLESSLERTKLESWLARLSAMRVHVSLPRFKLKESFELRDPLAALGMPVAFGSGADFSGMTGTRDFAISAVVHQAYVEAEERGTEAAAATAVVMSRAAMVAAPPQEFRADHPFLFLIRDNRTGSILFLGRVVRP